jgi:hypothetical protein
MLAEAQAVCTATATHFTQLKADWVEVDHHLGRGLITAALPHFTVVAVVVAHILTQVQVVQDTKV